MEPLIAAASQEIEQLRQDIRAGLTGQPSALANWRPYPEGNTIAGLVAHMYDAANFLLRAGLGEEVIRDREAQFAAAMPDIETVLAHVDSSTDNVLALAASFTADDLARSQEFRGRTIVGSWFVLHACTHMLEHWGQIQMIRDLHGR